MSDSWFHYQLSVWYAQNKRDLPWRDTLNPYHIWLSEIILQQTRVIQGLPYYQKFTINYNSVQEFAAAPLDDILKLWQGLGYYSRARNMHICSQSIVNDYRGEFPSSYQELLKLRGVGKYTAAAIASICFEEKVPTIDGNVFRLLSRVFGISDDTSQAKSFKVFFKKALELMPNQGLGNFNQSMMEYGATVCLPKKPDCKNCILIDNCFAQKHALISKLPVKSKKVKVRNRYFDYVVYLHDGDMLIQQRTSGDIWEGLFQFHLIESANENCNEIEESKVFSGNTVKHVLTHQKLYIKFHIVEILDGETFSKYQCDYGLISVPIAQLHAYAVPKPIELFLNQEFFPYFSTEIK